MSKNKRNWCDSKYEKKESTFDTGYLAERLVNTLTDWVINDFTVVKGMNVTYVCILSLLVLIMLLPGSCSFSLFYKEL